MPLTATETGVDCQSDKIAESAVEEVERFPRCNEHDLCVVSWNMLADYMLSRAIQNPHDLRYKHAVDAAPWETRFARLCEVFEQQLMNVDVFSLQEVDFDRFHQDMIPYFAKRGFTGLHQHDEQVEKQRKKQSSKGKKQTEVSQPVQPPHAFGVAFFYDNSKFRETFRQSRFRAFTVGLTLASVDKDGPSPKLNEWFLVNVHLEAAREKNEQRMAQLSSTLFNLSLNGSVNPRTARVIVMGDFNSTKTDPPFQWLLDGNPTKGHEDKENTGEETTEPLTHAFQFSDAYHSALSGNSPTYADPLSSGRVDHVLFTEETCEISAVLRVPNVARKFGVFGEDFPSDHYPVGCIAKPLPIPTELLVQEEQSQDVIDPNVCPLTPGQFRVLEFLELGAPKQPKKGKPSPSELALIREHKHRIKVFCSHLSKSQVAWVTKWRTEHKSSADSKQVIRSEHHQATRRKSVSALRELDLGLHLLFESHEEQGNKQPPPSVPARTRNRASLPL